MSSVERFSVAKIAKLARLDVPVEHADRVQNELKEVLSWIGQIDELDLAEVTPYFGSADSDAIRDDAIVESLPRPAALRNAPDQDGEYYRVPPVF